MSINSQEEEHKESPKESQLGNTFDALCLQFMFMYVMMQEPMQGAKERWDYSLLIPISTPYEFLSFFLSTNVHFAVVMLPKLFYEEGDSRPCSFLRFP